MSVRTLGIALAVLIVRAYSSSAQTSQDDGLRGLSAYHVDVSSICGAEARVDTAVLRIKAELGLRRVGVKVLSTDSSSVQVGYISVAVDCLALHQNGQASGASAYVVQLGVRRWLSTFDKPPTTILGSVWIRSYQGVAPFSQVQDGMAGAVELLTDALANSILAVK